MVTTSPDLSPNSAFVWMIIQIRALFKASESLAGLRPNVVTRRPLGWVSFHSVGVVCPKMIYKVVGLVRG